MPPFPLRDSSVPQSKSIDSLGSSFNALHRLWRKAATLLSFAQMRLA